MAFTTIPIRETGRTAGRVAAAWFNTLRTAILELQSLVGTGSIVPTDFTIANNQASAANVTGLVFSSADTKSVKVTADIRRKTATASSEVVAHHILFLQYRDQTSTWEVASSEAKGDDSGVTLTVTSVGQVQYVSTSIAGSSYTGTMRFKAETIEL